MSAVGGALQLAAERGPSTGRERGGQPHSLQGKGKGGGGVHVYRLHVSSIELPFRW